MLGPPTSATCSPLLIPELFRCILDCFSIPKGDLGVNSPPGTREDLRETQRTLAALAQTCRALSEPSLDRLWRRLDSLEPLVRCIARAVNVNRARIPPSPAEWTIITRYSHRVREVALESFVDALFLESASSSCQSPFLFPNLSALRWSVSSNRRDSDLTATMHRLLSPSLASLSVTFDQGDRRIHSFLQNYVLLCPGLKSFRFDIYHSLFQPGKVFRLDIHQLSQAICTHEEHLESLELFTPIDDVALRHVMLSPQLRVVSLVLHPKRSNLGNIRITSADTPFCNVKELELHAWDLHFVPRLLRPQDQMFHTFRLRLRGQHQAKTISAFLTTLASPQRMDSLQSIHLTFGYWYDLSDPEEQIPSPIDNATYHCLTYDTLHPLASLRHLRELVLNLVNQACLNDAELAELARSWPMLEVLKLDCNAGFYKPFAASITLRGLLSVLAHCPRLRELGLPLDAREIPEKTSVDVCNTILTSFQLADCESPIGDARLVAGFFSIHLSSVTQVDPTSAPVPSRSHPEYDLLWGKVNEYL